MGHSPNFLFFYLNPRTHKRTVSLNHAKLPFYPLTLSSSSPRRRFSRRLSRWRSSGEPAISGGTPKLQGAISFSSELCLTRFLRRWNRLDEIYTFTSMGVRKIRKTRTQIREITCTAGEEKSALLTGKSGIFLTHRFITFKQQIT